MGRFDFIEKTLEEDEELYFSPKYLREVLQVLYNLSSPPTFEGVPFKKGELLHSDLHKMIYDFNKHSLRHFYSGSPFRIDYWKGRAVHALIYPAKRTYKNFFRKRFFIRIDWLAHTKQQKKYFIGYIKLLAKEP